MMRGEKNNKKEKRKTRKKKKKKKTQKKKKNIFFQKTFLDVLEPKTSHRTSFVSSFSFWVQFPLSSQEKNNLERDGRQ